MTLESSIRKEAVRLGADLVGFAPVSRWEKAPADRRPQATFPDAKNVIVCGIHFLDAPTELGAEKDPRDPGPAMTEMNVSHMLHEVAWSLAKLLQRQGHQATFVRQSGQWRYRGANGDRGFAADMCHYYAAACAGLAEIGWNNLALTPEFGPRQRWVSILTDADLEPTPLYNGTALCDRCKLCVKHCPTESFTKDASGRMLNIEIEDKRYEFPERNLWRCGIGENFMLDVFLDKWKDQEVNEELIVKTQEEAVYEKNEWISGWKMGMCLKHCLPPQRRYFDRDYCRAPRRRRDVASDYSPENLDRATNELLKAAPHWDIDMLATIPATTFAKEDINLKDFMPDAASVIVIGLGYPEHSMLNTDFAAAKAEIMVSKLLQEKYGFSVLPRSEMDNELCARLSGLARPISEAWQTDSPEDAERTRHTSLRLDAEDSQLVSDRFGHHQIWRSILVSAPFQAFKTDVTASSKIESNQSKAKLTEAVREAARAGGADLVGIAPAERLEKLPLQLDEIFHDPDYFAVEDKTIQPLLEVRKRLWGAQAYPFTPESRKVELKAKRPSDYLTNAKSVIVVGVELLDASIDALARGEAQKAGHFHATVHEEPFNQLANAMRKATRVLDHNGGVCMTSRDLTGLAGEVCGAGADLTASRFAALAAGLGELGLNGVVLTPQFGGRQRFACIITDLELEYDDVYRGSQLCHNCGSCIEACPVQALVQDNRNSVEIEGQTYTWAERQQLTCDFVQRYGFIPESGGKYSNCQNSFPLPEKITPEYIVECMRQSDRIERPGYKPTVQSCFTKCNAHKKMCENNIISENMPLEEVKN